MDGCLSEKCSALFVDVDVNAVIFVDVVGVAEHGSTILCPFLVVAVQTPTKKKQ